MVLKITEIIKESNNVISVDMVRCVAFERSRARCNEATRPFGTTKRTAAEGAAAVCLFVFFF